MNGEDSAQLLLDLSGRSESATLRHTSNPAQEIQEGKVIQFTDALRFFQEDQKRAAFAEILREQKEC